MPTPFLTARWENLLLLNYRCPADLLLPRLPKGVELDAWAGQHLVSLVGFEFRDTRLHGLAVPGHRSFEEVNLRFYVRREAPEGTRRGVVFIREVVPHRLVAAAARYLYNEPYVAMPVTRVVDLDGEAGGSVTYSWTHREGVYRISGTVQGPASTLTPGSKAEFITEHYWGYSTQRGGATLEYRVEHPRWLVWECRDARYTAPSDPTLYGPTFTEVLAAEPVSAFVALGSRVVVYRGEHMDTA